MSVPPSDGSGASISKRIALLAIEILLVVIILGLLIATWLPALIGANPDAPRGPSLP